MSDSLAAGIVGEAPRAIGFRGDAFRQIAWTALVMVVLIGGFRLLMAVEPVAHRRDGIVGGRPVSTAAILVGLAHFAIAFFFSMTSRAGSSKEVWRRLLLGLAAGAALCGILAVGIEVAPLLFPSVFVGVYFITHEVRDEYFFCRTLGSVPGGRFDRTGFLLFLGAVVFAGLSLYWQWPFIRPDHRGAAILRPVVDLSALSGPARALWRAVPSMVLIAVAAALFRLSLRRAGMGLGEFCRAYAPLCAVYLLLLALLFLAPRSERSIYLIVTFHVAAWWVFTSRHLARRGRRGSPRDLGWCAWFRETQAGFQTLHLGLVVGIVALAAVWTYGFDRFLGNPLAWLVSPQAFPYWTIGHVTVSFLPKP